MGKKKGVDASAVSGRREGKKGRYKKPFIPDAADYVFIRGLEEEGLRVENMASDGNCMFRSLGHQLFSDPNQHLPIRKRIMDYIEERKEHFSLFIEDDETFEEYVERMRAFGEWGDHTELFAAAQCFQVDIIIHQADTPKYKITAEQGAKKVIHLSFHGECHYNSVVPMSGPVPSAVESPQRDDPSAAISEDTIDLVARSVPWVNESCIRQALVSCQSDVDAAIDLLCAGVGDLSLPATIDASPADSEATPVAIVKKNHKNTAGWAGKKEKVQRRADALLSKKERRKLERERQHPSPAAEASANALIPPLTMQVISI